MSMLEIRGVRKRFGEKQVLDGVDFSVPKGSVFGFIGQNGAGKTTLMKTVLGLLRADEGEIFVCGERVTYGETATNRHVGYLPDVPEFYGFMTAREYLNFCGEITGMERADLKNRTGELLELVGLEKERHRVGGFSRGMKQRLGIAQALLSRPKLLICDEPTSALDPMGRKEILDTLQAVREQTTVLFSTHILSDVERICSEIALLHRGKIRLQGKLSEIKSRRRGAAYLVETDGERSECRLLNCHPDLLTKNGDGGLLLTGDESALSAVLATLAREKLPLVRIERQEPTLESLFMEELEK